ncbi:hypothetical protein K745_gp41 [Haloarcula hispanica virus PH1]|uniref:Uncharacterized protein n=1 Tax=Haloarcula hispanica virus PH1 TaxID=1282967 RepID=M4JFM5_9VIRU|nr:hypothetical protein K745_gp41 [Haloarcula hispanica virus PH1]AGC65566.1 hypothetical protein HhPH1_gp41 [Haloarcula hispanica virus PH1]
MTIETFTCPMCGTGPQREDRSGKRDCRRCEWEYRPSRDRPSGSEPSKQVGLDNW